jgi:hypothetical protein
MSTGDYLNPLECAIEVCGLSTRATVILDAYRCNPKLPDWPEVGEKLAEVRHAIHTGQLKATRASRSAEPSHDLSRMLHDAMNPAPEPEPRVNRHELRGWIRQSVPYEAIAHERDTLKRQVAELETRVATVEKERDKLKARLKPAPAVEPRKEATYLRTIGALLALLTGKTALGKPNSDFPTRTAVKAAIKHRFAGIRGLSDRKLDDLFKLACDSLNSPDD